MLHVPQRGPQRLQLALVEQDAPRSASFAALARSWVDDDLGGRSANLFLMNARRLTLLPPTGRLIHDSGLRTDVHCGGRKASLTDMLLE